MSTAKLSEAEKRLASAQLALFTTTRKLRALVDEYDRLVKALCAPKPKRPNKVGR